MSSLKYSLEPGVMPSSFAASACKAASSHVVHTTMYLNQWLIPSLFSFVEGRRKHTAYLLLLEATD